MISVDGQHATIKAYRRPGGAIVNVTRRGRTRRYVVGLKRWAWLRTWCNVGGPYRTSGYHGSDRLDVRIDTKRTWKAMVL